jgi:hypothetical protein
MARLLHSEGAAIDPWEHYVHQSIRNRYHILTANGTMALTIPVKSQHGMHIPTCRVEIAYEKPWQRLHLRTLQAAYRSAPFWEHYEPALAEALSGNDNTLGDLFQRTMPLWLRLLKTDVQPTVAQAYLETTPEHDLRKAAKNPSWWNAFATPIPYPQVWTHKHGFTPYLSVVDLLLNEGPAAMSILRAMAK